MQTLIGNLLENPSKSLLDAVIYLLELPHWDGKQFYSEYLEQQLSSVPVGKLRRALEATGLIFRSCLNFEALELLGVEDLRKRAGDSFAYAEFEKPRWTREEVLAHPHRVPNSKFFPNLPQHNLFYQFLENLDYQGESLYPEGYSWYEEPIFIFLGLSRWLDGDEVMYSNGLVPNFVTMKTTSDTEGLDPERFELVVRFTDLYYNHLLPMIRKIQRKSLTGQADYSQIMPNPAIENNGLISVEEFAQRVSR